MNREYVVPTRYNIFICTKHFRVYQSIAKTKENKILIATRRRESIINLRNSNKVKEFRTIFAVGIFENLFSTSCMHWDQT